MTINVFEFVKENVNVYYGNEEFLKNPTEKTIMMWNHCLELLKKELENKEPFIDNEIISTITSHQPGFILNKYIDNVCVGLQGDEPLQRTMKPLGGYKLVKTALNEYNKTFPQNYENIFKHYRKTHNDGVFDVYNEQIRKARKSGIITGLPDNYGRGRIIGDYRRVPLYGISKLIQEKQNDKNSIQTFDEESIRICEEISEQIRALKDLQTMGEMYGFDLSRPANDAQEAVQWLYLSYLAAVKQQDGAAMSIGSIDAFLDIYFERDLQAGLITEQDAQEIIDHFVIKLRLVRHLRPHSYDEIFAGDPTWVTLSIGGHYVTKTSFRIIHSLSNLGPSPEPNMTILWLPNHDDFVHFKKYCCKMSINTCSLQYENDELMQTQQELQSDDISIACCVSATVTGKQMQLFGARCNMPKLLLYCINNGYDEKSETKICPLEFEPCVENGILDFDKVMNNFRKGMEWMAELYCNTMNIIHFMHDKYNYESLEMALHDTDVHRFIAFGMAGLSIVADSLSAIKHATVSPSKIENGIIKDYQIQGEFPMYGNDNDDVDNLAVWTTEYFMQCLKKQKTYRHAQHTLSVLTITSNVMYGKKTGATPDGRKAGEPFAPGANPGHGRDQHGALCSLNSVSKIPYDSCMDGISNTFTIIPGTLGKEPHTRIENLTALINGYFMQNAHHLNVNVLNRETLEDAMENPLKYPQLTIRVSGYAVMFNRLSKEQQLEVISRTFHKNS